MCWYLCRSRNREYGHRDPLCWPYNSLYPQKLALTSPTGGGCSVSIVHSRTKAMDFLFVYVLCCYRGTPTLAILRTPAYASSWQRRPLESATAASHIPGSVLSPSFTFCGVRTVNGHHSWLWQISIVTDYGLDGWGVAVWVPVGPSSLLHVIQTCFEAYPASSPVGTRGSFPMCKADCLLPASGKINMWIYTSTLPFVFMAWCLSS
jgi:hypothetical protein